MARFLEHSTDLSSFIDAVFPELRGGVSVDIVDESFSVTEVGMCGESLAEFFWSFFTLFLRALYEQGLPVNLRARVIERPLLIT